MNPGYLPYAGVGLNYLFRRIELPAGRVLGLTIEPTNICNLACVYCPQSDRAHHFLHGRGSMTFETYRRILDNILADFSPRFVSLHRDGEPLLNNELERFIEYAVSKGIRTGTSSNCTIIPPERTERLLDAGLSFIKTDFCADRRLFERLRAGGDWGAAYEGMRALLTAADDRGIGFRMNITDLSTHGLTTEAAEVKTKELAKLFAGFERYISIMPVYFHNALGESIEPMTGGGSSVAAGAADEGKAAGDREAAAADYREPAADGHGAGRVVGRDGRYFLCHHPWVHIVVDFLGNVVPCCRDLRSEYICGNLLEDSMLSIWNNDRFTAVRRALAGKRPEDINICRKCDLPYRGSYAGMSYFSKVRNILFSKTWKR